jgi:hypothetical protein
MAILSLEEAKLRLRVTWGEEDADITGCLRAAEAAAIQFLNRNVYGDGEQMQAAISAGVAGASPMVATPDLKTAMLVIVANMFADRENWTIPAGAYLLLWPHRIGMGI